MKRRWKIALCLLLLAIIAGGFLFSRKSRAEGELEETKQALRKQGFKTELADFEFSIPDDVRQRTAILATTTRQAMKNPQRADPIFGHRDLQLMSPLGSNTSIVIWKERELRDRNTIYPGYEFNDLWPLFREHLKAGGLRLAAMQEAAISGPIRFEPIDSDKPNALLPYLADLKSVEWTFATAAMVALHDGKPDEAWTNVLASSCLVTEYAPEPIGISHLVRCACVPVAFNTLWNALQAHHWADQRLGDLQRRWENVDFLSALPETFAHTRAETVAMFELERHEPVQSPVTFKDALRSPRTAFPLLRDRWTSSRYRVREIYEDEKAVLLHYRDRELEQRNAIKARTWIEMRDLPGVTNQIPFAPTHRRGGRTLSYLNLRQMNVNIMSEGRGLLSHVAEAESQRRLIITALALERFRNRHGSYPAALSELAPEFLAKVPEDFMDGKPLRYERASDDRFVLYSVGLDCVDNGGVAWEPKQQADIYGFGQDYDFRQRSQARDLVWPRPALDSESEHFQQERKKAETEKLASAEESEAQDEWDRSLMRQAQVEKILNGPPPRVTGVPAGLVALLRASDVSNTNQPALGELLTLRQVVSGAEPEKVTFELPMKYDAVTNLGEVTLCIDINGDEDSDEGFQVHDLEFARGPNGTCRLIWNTIYECEGKHALQAVLILDKPEESSGLKYANLREFAGPILPFTVTNLCQFSSSSAHFQRAYGVTLRARLQESNGIYELQIKTPEGQPVRTFSGTTSNGVVAVHWDLTDERGTTCTNDAFDTVVHISLPGSGRSQTLKGP
jgi:hypothetical protein